MSTENRSRASNSVTYEAVVGFVLEDLRKRKRLSQTDLASAVGITQSSWSRIERGLATISITQLRRASRRLEILPSGVLHGVEDHVVALRRAGFEVIDAPSEPKDAGLPLAGAALAGLLLGLSVVAAKSK